MDPFTAHFCFVEVAGNSFRAGLADNQNDTSRYVLFERLKEPDAQDLKFGFEAPHFEIDDQVNSGYGLLERIVLADRTLTVWPNAEGEQVLRLNGPIQISISREADLNGFETVMKSIFGPIIFSNGQPHHEAAQTDRIQDTGI
jgi:hypothetical protein